MDPSSSGQPPRVMLDNILCPQAQDQRHIESFLFVSYPMVRPMSSMLQVPTIRTLKSPILGPKNFPSLGQILGT